MQPTQHRDRSTLWLMGRVERDEPRTHGKQWRTAATDRLPGRRDVDVEPGIDILYTMNIVLGCEETYAGRMMSKRAAKPSITDQHKAAMAEGRVEGRVVRDYLEALRNSKGRPGRKRTAESVSRRLAAVEAELVDASPVQELELVQERLDLQVELESMQAKVDPATLEAGFVKIAAAYSKRKGISYTAWRAVGVQPSVLKKAGIPRT